MRSTRGKKSRTAHHERTDEREDEDIDSSPRSADDVPSYERIFKKTKKLNKASVDS